MILLYNPKATRFVNRRLPLSVLAIAAVLEGKESYTVVDPYPTDSRVALLKEHPVELLAVTVVPGPQTVGAVAPCPEIRTRFPNVTIVWGGYFASDYTAAARNVGYVDYAVRGQGQTILELLDVLRGHRDRKTTASLSYKNSEGRARRRHRGLHQVPPGAQKVAGSRDYWRTLRASPQAGANVWRSCGRFEFPTTAGTHGAANDGSAWLRRKTR